MVGIKRLDGSLALGLALGTLAASGGACGRGTSPQPAASAAPADSGDLSTRAVNAAADTRVLSEAQDAANKVVRAAGDCEAAKAAMGEAQQKLDAAAPQLRTATARDSLQRMREQLRKIAEACP